MTTKTFFVSEELKLEASERVRLNGVYGIIWTEWRKCRDGSGWMHWGKHFAPLRATRAQIVDKFGLR